MSRLGRIAVKARETAAPKSDSESSRIFNSTKVSAIFRSIRQASLTPWWLFSFLFHSLAITLLSTITMTLEAMPNDRALVTTLESECKLNAFEDVSASTGKKLSVPTCNLPAIDIPEDKIIPSGMESEQGDHFENNNPDMPEQNGANGEPDADMLYCHLGALGTVGGGGIGGSAMEDLFGVGSTGSPGFGDGWGGGNGSGVGDAMGSEKASFGIRKNGRKFCFRATGCAKYVSSSDLALEWLAKHQEPDGHWDCVKYGGKQADVATTGLALLALVGAGHSEKIGTYRDNVKRAIQWLQSNQHEDGAIYKQGEISGIGYHHAIAGMAMAEASGMSRNPETIRSAQKAVDYSIRHQQGEPNEKLGWRYGPNEKGDLSVSGWFVMQLKTAKMAKLKIDPASLEGAKKFLDSVELKSKTGEESDANRFGYSAPGDGFRTTAIGCLSRQFIGWKREETKGGIEYFVEKGGLPQWDSNGNSVDLYYWYFGTHAVFNQDAPCDLWKRWNSALQSALLEHQHKDGDASGSWDPVGRYSEYWGRVGQTALAALCFEFYYRNTGYVLMTK